MTIHAKRALLLLLCGIGIPAIVIASLLFGRPEQQPLAALRLTEIMNNNLSCYAAADGVFYDWVELTNTGLTALDLTGLSLTDDPTDPQAFVFEDTVLPAGSSLVVPLTGDAAEQRHGYAPFGLSSAGDTVYLFRGDTELDRLSIESSPENVSFGRQDTREVWFAVPTPAAANSGICAETLTALEDICYEGVLISEVCAVSRERDGDTPYDWVELWNTTDAPVSLDGYRLTEDITAEGLRFDGVTLAADERLVILCDADGVADTLCAPFSLNPNGDTLLLVAPSGAVCDRFESGKQRFGITSGRRGTDRRSRVFFDTPTRGTANGDGAVGYAPMPSVNREGGYAQSGDTVTLTVPTHCTVYYTTDGSEPTAQSTPYTDGTAIAVGSTTVLRAVAVRDGYLPSDVLTQTYLAEDAHDLPVVSVSGDPAALFGGDGAFTDYTDDSHEVLVYTEYFEADGSKAVAFPSHLRLAGGLSRNNVQKAFSLNLNQAAGQSSVTYPFFDTATTDTYANLLLRPSGSDWKDAKLRDEFAAEALDGIDGFVVQAVQPVALYINGQYYGLYYLREKRNEAFVSAETGIPEERVELAKTPALYENRNNINADMRDLIEYAKKHDLRQEEHYNYVIDRIDRESLMRFYAVQTWFGNGDVINNTAYYRDTTDGRWHWIVFDMDWACSSYYQNFQFIKQLYEGSGEQNYRNYYDPLMTALLKNEDFCREFLKIYKNLTETTLSTERLLPILDRMAAEIESEIPRQYARYGAPSTLRWNQQVNFMRSFVSGRTEVIVAQLCEVFSLTEEEWNNL